MLNDISTLQKSCAAYHSAQDPIRQLHPIATLQAGLAGQTGTVSSGEHILTEYADGFRFFWTMLRPAKAQRQSSARPIHLDGIDSATMGEQGMTESERKERAYMAAQKDKLENI